MMLSVRSRTSTDHVISNLSSCHGQFRVRAFATTFITTLKWFKGKQKAFKARTLLERLDTQLLTQKKDEELLRLKNPT